MEVNVLLIRRLWSFIRASPKTGCWEWQGSTHNEYGVFKLGDKTVRAHRLFYILFVATPRLHDYILHRCDNPRCCNPDHLFSGTAKENSQDALKKGRLSEKTFFKKGTEHKAAKLIEAHVRWAREQKKKGMSSKKIAQYLKVGVSTIEDAIKGKSWSHVKQESEVISERHSWSPESLLPEQGE